MNKILTILQRSLKQGMPFLLGTGMLLFFIFCLAGASETGRGETGFPPDASAPLKNDTSQGAADPDIDRPPFDTTNWPQFRGVQARGIAVDLDLPLEWDVRTGANILWKTPIPGLGHSSPVVWDNKVFITTAVGEGGKEAYLKVGLFGESPDNPENFVHHFRLYCLDRTTGKIIWEKTAHSGVPQIARHIKSSHANSSPATDGKHVLAFFGSEGLYCYDMEGELLWKKDFGLLDAGAFDYPEIRWGFGCSPVIHDGKAVILADVNNQSFLTVLDIKTGREIWKTLRDENPTWGTPTIYTAVEKSQILVNGFKHIGAYDFDTGEEIWKMHGGGDIPVPTPFVAHDLVFITNSHGRMRPIYAVRVDAKGDITLEQGKNSNASIPWSYPRMGTYQPTPMVYGDLLYILDDRGIVRCYEAVTGKIVFQKTLGGEISAYSASVVAADGRIYCTDEFGKIHIIKASRTYEHLAVNDMGETCMATPALSHKTLFVRTRSTLYAIGKK
ncbi:MAG: PQQ-binding-like beta-propeller repeat protein [Acidobacteria bacterium]|nr:PQQ-binding-like beta-propeller repeat protein [Acidobacteriota bacterium]